jgi:hypothetical protein
VPCRSITATDPVVRGLTVAERAGAANEEWHPRVTVDVVYGRPCLFMVADDRRRAIVNG